MTGDKESSLIIFVIVCNDSTGKPSKMEEAAFLFACGMNCYASRADMVCGLIAFKGPCPVNTLAPRVAGFCVPILK